jgi:hypothetical protein
MLATMTTMLMLMPPVEAQMQEESCSLESLSRLEETARATQHQSFLWRQLWPRTCPCWRKQQKKRKWVLLLQLLHRRLRHSAGVAGGTRGSWLVHLWWAREMMTTTTTTLELRMCERKEGPGGESERMQAAVRERYCACVVIAYARCNARSDLCRNIETINTLAKRCKSIECAVLTPRGSSSERKRPDCRSRGSRTVSHGVDREQ